MSSNSGVFKIRSQTLNMAKRGQVFGLYGLTVPLKEKSHQSGVGMSTCSQIIKHAKQISEETGNLDLCAAENLAPRLTNMKGNRAYSTKEKRGRYVTWLQQTRYIAKWHLQSWWPPLPSNITISRVLTADNLNICKPLTKPFLSARAKERRLIVTRNIGV